MLIRRNAITVMCVSSCEAVNWLIASRAWLASRAGFCVFVMTVAARRLPWEWPCISFFLHAETWT